MLYNEWKFLVGVTGVICRGGVAAMSLDKPLLIEFREHSMAAFERSAWVFQFQILASYRGERRIYSTYISRERRVAKRRRLL